MWLGWYSPRSTKSHRSTSYASSHRMLVGASARRSLSMRKKLYVFGPQDQSSHQMECRAVRILPGGHSRDHVTTAELALDADGKFVGMRVHTVANLGAYLSPLRLACRRNICDAVGRSVHDAEYLLRRARCLHKHRTGRCLSRRRPA